jgi:F-type H+-transporting ATPase subunit delta
VGAPDPSAIDRIDEVFEEARREGELARVAEDLISLTGLFRREPRLRAALGDIFLAPEAKRRLLRAVLSGKVANSTLQLLYVVVQRPELARKAQQSVDDLAVLGVFAAADGEDHLDEVEEELFRVSRILQQEHSLRHALTDPGVPADKKDELISDVLGDKAGPHTLFLLKLVIDRHRTGDLAGRVHDLAALAAERRGRVMVEARTAVPLDDERRQGLEEALRAVTGKGVDLKVLVDPSIGGGVVARVGDEVIDGSVEHKLQLAMQQMTRP